MNFQLRLLSLVEVHFQLKYKEQAASKKEVKQVVPEAVKFKYLYNGKELQDELGLNIYDYGARTYDPAAPRFWQVDPDAEKYQNQSVYVYADDNPVRFMDIDGKGTEEQEWKPVIGQPGKWEAEKGDSAATLAKDAGISYQKANNLVQKQLGKNKVVDGKEYSNVKPGDVVEVEAEYIVESTEEVFIQYPDNQNENLKKIDSIDKKISFKWAEYENYSDYQKNEIRNNPNVYDRDAGGIYGRQVLKKGIEKKIDDLHHIKDSLKKISKPDTFYYNVIRVKKNNLRFP